MLKNYPYRDQDAGNPGGDYIKRLAQINSEREALEEVEIRDKNNAIQSNKNLSTENIKIEDDLKKSDKPIAKTKSKKEGTLKEIKNLTKEIEYITTNKNGDIYKISARGTSSTTSSSPILSKFFQNCYQNQKNLILTTKITIFNDFEPFFL